MMTKERKKALLWLVFSILFLSLVGVSLFVVKLHRDYHHVPSEHLIGNKVSNVNALKENGFPFSFLVMGDTRNRKKAEVLIKKAMKKGDISFMIHLGDFLSDPDIWAHRLFLTGMTVRIKPTFPIFLTPGNHDVDYSSPETQQAGRRIPRGIYESLYGARNFDFTFNHCLFILCGVDLGNPSAYLKYLQDTLSQKAERKKYVFIFIHYAPKTVTSASELPEEEKFFSLLDSYKITACFFGHYHGYRRSQRNGVNLIVSGGGGARLSGAQGDWGKFNHLMKINVNENIITEDIITAGEGPPEGGSFERWAFARILPIVDQRIWTLYLLALLFLTGGIYSALLSIRLTKKGGAS